MTTASIPIEFLALGLDCNKFFRKRQNEYHGPCPFCGGGTDRFRIHTDRPFPHWNWECRKCGRKGWADQLNPRLRDELTPEMRAEYARKNQEAEVARKNTQATALARYQKSRIWEKYHENLTERHRAWWRSQGIPDQWQDFWQLGYVPDLALGKTISRQAYTIPKFGFGGIPTNLDYRVVDPLPEIGKYRPIKGLPIAPFLSMPFLSGPMPESFVVEGSKKAMVLASCNVLGVSGRACIIGIPGCNSWAGVELMTGKCQRTWIMLDPGAENWAHKLAMAIGQCAIVVELPDKPDDMVLAGATRADFLALMRDAEHGDATRSEPHWIIQI